jgi:AcrR family transcriptional regulator
VTAVAAPGAAGARARILDAALPLVGELGAAGTSMRRLAAACGLNVATIYHYFPSKADLLRALIEERRYGERMAADDPPADSALPPDARFRAFFAWLVARTLEEETVLRMLLGEGLRADPTARSSARDLLAALDTTVSGWLTAGFPEIVALTPAPTAARAVRRALLALLTEHLATGQADVASYAEDLAALLLSARASGSSP